MDLSINFFFFLIFKVDSQNLNTQKIENPNQTQTFEFFFWVHASDCVERKVHN